MMATEAGKAGLAKTELRHGITQRRVTQLQVGSCVHPRSHLTSLTRSGRRGD